MLLTAAQETARNYELINLVLSRASQSPSAAAKAVEHVAYKWHNPNLWVRTVKSCSIMNGLTIFSDYTTIFKAISEFGFDAIKEGYATFIHKSPGRVNVNCPT
jgi:hypothetical protein